MLRILPLADGVILPQAKQESYFFNRIDLNPSAGSRHQHEPPSRTPVAPFIGNNIGRPSGRP
ncbi:hypothetical protein DND36_10905 [Pseudomonas savastanoi pv. glycinea]|nr:hypothetical protein DND36_10905 [Pseudomonas savastanoi pv. glycinea]RMQ84679.1 hypothetical protein ALP95_03055 [Pseudomonas savastanoi pv. glycinea]